MKVFNKEVSNVLRLLERYCLAMGIVGVPDAWLFPVSGKDESMMPKDAQYWFEKVLRLADISFPGRKKHERGLCLHCIHHVFVFKSFASVERAGRRIDASIPYLSIYLGHDSLQETEKIRFIHDLYGCFIDVKVLLLYQFSMKEPNDRGKLAPVTGKDPV